MTDHGGVAHIALSQEAGQIGDVSIERVGLLADRLLGQPETDHVRNDHAPACRGQRLDEFPVQKAPGGVAVQENDRIAGALVDVMHAPAVDLLEFRIVRPLLMREPLRSFRRLHPFPPYPKKITAWPLRPGSLTTGPRDLPVAKSNATTSSWATQYSFPSNPKRRPRGFLNPSPRSGIRTRTRRPL